MLVQDLISIAKNGEISDLNLKNGDNSLMYFIYLGLVELYDIFNVAIKVETIETFDSVPIYTLRNEDINQVITVYDSKNVELKLQGVIGCNDYDVTKINFNTFLFKAPKNENVVFVYKASPALITSVTQNVELPAAMINALMDFIAYKSYSTMSGAVNSDADNYRAKFERSCSKLENKGYVNDLYTVVKNVKDKGFV